VSADLSDERYPLKARPQATPESERGLFPEAATETRLMSAIAVATMRVLEGSRADEWIRFRARPHVAESDRPPGAVIDVIALLGRACGRPYCEGAPTERSRAT
jgi:hypothetical protein